MLAGEKCVTDRGSHLTGTMSGDAQAEMSGHMLIKWDDMKAQGAVKVQVAWTSRFDQRKVISGLKERTQIGMDSSKRRKGQWPLHSLSHMSSGEPA